MEATVSYETLVRLYQATRHHMDVNLEIHPHEDIISYNLRITHKDGVSKCTRRMICLSAGCMNLRCPTFEPVSPR
jgi:hypothetical protein